MFNIPVVSNPFPHWQDEVVPKYKPPENWIYEEAKLQASRQAVQQDPQRLSMASKIENAKRGKFEDIQLINISRTLGKGSRYRD